MPDDAMLVYARMKQLIRIVLDLHYSFLLESRTWNLFVSNVGDAILLSPACASFDEFKNFEHRGKFFQELAFSPQFTDEL